MVHTTYDAEKTFNTIPGYASYEIDKTGRIRNEKTGRLLKTQILNGYAVISLMNEQLNKQRKERVHRLVALTYIGEPPQENYQVNHLDGNKLNNSVSNLQWVSPSENMIHYYSNIGNGHPRRVKLIFSKGNERYEYKSMCEAADALGVALSTIWSASLQGSYKGFKLERVVEYNEEVLELS